MDGGQAIKLYEFELSQKHKYIWFFYDSQVSQGIFVICRESNIPFLQVSVYLCYSLFKCKFFEGLFTFV